MSDDDAEATLNTIIDNWIKTHNDDIIDLLIKDIILYGKVQPETILSIKESFND